MISFVVTRRWQLSLLSLGMLLTLAPDPLRRDAVVAAQYESLDPGLGDWIQRFSADRKSIEFKHREPLSAVRREQLTQLYRVYLADLEKINFPGLSLAGKIDYVLLRNELDYQLQLLRLEGERDAAAMRWLPGIEIIVALLEEHERSHELPPRQTAEQLVAIRTRLSKEVALWPAEPTAVEQTAGIRAVVALKEVRKRLADLHQFYLEYDPLYTWWCKNPYELLSSELEKVEGELGKRCGNTEDPDKIIGQPIGSEGMEIELRHEMIPYSPAELIEIAEREFRWCDQQMLAAANAMGHGDDWRAAMETVKQRHVDPGKQPAMIRNLAEESIRFLKDRDLLTIPTLCEQAWRMEMMSPERQRVNPFFLGGDTIIVSYPTEKMTHAEKLMSMRGNNEHFARATVQHELIPGHHLQWFMMDRYRPYRKAFETPFWIEGWALYWEMLLWDLDFPRSPEDRVGMLFWRKHRCARIIFSLGYQLGRMTPEQCVDYLVERVGHERLNAEAEVRRSVMGGYSPLYQAAYMLGGLQIRALHKELVESGTISNRDFHDAILRQGPIPITLVRSALTGEPPLPTASPGWRFAEEVVLEGAEQSLRAADK